MTLRFFLRTSLRELRGARRRLLFFCTCMAVGVAAVVGVAALLEALELSIRLRARELLGGDLSVESRRPLPDLSTLLPAEYQQLPRVDMRILSSMVRTQAGATRLAEVKAVDTSHGSYPLAGNLKLSPEQSLASLLQDDTILIAPQLRDELHVAVGDTLYLGSQALRVAGLILEEPDPLTFTFSFGPRVLITSTALARANLLTFGSRARYRSVLALPKSTTEAQLERAMQQLERAIPGAGSYVSVESYRQAQPALRGALERVERYLGLVALLSLLVASVGVAQVVAAWLAQAARQTAIYRCLGLSSREVFFLYLGHVGLLALLSSLIGALLGSFAPHVVSAVDASLLPREALSVLAIKPVVRGVILGVGSALLFSLPPLTAVWRVAPLRVLRSEAAPLPVPRAVQVITYGTLIVGLFSTALLQGGQARVAGSFTLGITLTAAILWFAGRGLLRLVSMLPRHRLPPLVWQGAAAMVRPSAGATTSIVALGLGTLVVLSVALVQGLLGRELVSAVPASAPSVFLMDVQPDQWPAVEQLIKSLGATHVQSVPVVTGRLVSVDGRSVMELMKERKVEVTERTREQWALSREQRITFSQELPADNRIVAGTLWSDPKLDELSIEAGFAEQINAKLGSKLRFDVQGVPVDFTLTSLRSVEWRSFSMNFLIVAEPHTLADAPFIRLGAARVAPRSEQQLQDTLVARFPNVTVLRVRALVERAGALLAQAALAVRLLGSFTVITGLFVLVGAIASSQLTRAREVALLKTLGVSRLRIAAMFAVEYGLSGALSGLLGALGAYALALLFARYVLLVSTLPAAGSCVAAIAITTALSMFGGLLASARALRVSPLLVLRGRS